MMNLFTLSEQLKDFSKGQLVQEMQSPSGSVPQYLVMSELQRRTRMEKEASTAEPAPQTTVAQDTVSAAGVPQAGVAQIARALAPKTDMANNTGIAAMQPQAAPTQRMQEGGVLGPNTQALEGRTTGVPQRIDDAIRRLEAAGVDRDTIDGWVASGMDLNYPLAQLPPGSAPEDIESLRPENPFEAATAAIERTISPLSPTPGMTRPPIIEPRTPLLPPPRELDGDGEPGMDTGTPLTSDDENLLPPGAGDAAGDAAGGAGSGAGGGAGGGAGDLFGDVDSDYETDRWLSLARFGLGLMSSREPTLGGAIGEAGAGALDSLSAAREGFRDRRLQQAEFDLAQRGMDIRAAAAAAAAAGGGAEGATMNQLVQRLQDQQEYLGEQLLLAEAPAQRMGIQQQLTAIQTQLGALLNIPVPESEGVIEARPGFLERLLPGGQE